MRFAAVFCLALRAVPVAAAPEAAVRYVVDSGHSTIRVHVGKTGLFSFAGHEHEIRATRIAGEIVADASQLGASHFKLTFEAGALQVSEAGEPAGDAPKVQEAMLGPKVLDVSSYPLVTFASRGVSGKAGPGGTFDLHVDGELALHGVTKALAVPVSVSLEGNTLTATGRVTLKQSDYGITPVSVAGVVKVKDELVVEFTVVASPSP